MFVTLESGRWIEDDRLMEVQSSYVCYFVKWSLDRGWPLNGGAIIVCL